MRNVSWPAFAKVADKVLHVRPHSRGFGSDNGFGQYERGPGARWQGSFAIVPMIADTALQFRAFIHSLRGVGGAFKYQLQDKTPAGPSTGPAIYTDGTDYTDDTTYTDTVDRAGTGTVTASAGDTAITVSGLGGVTLAAGDFAYIGEAPYGQLVRVISVDGTDLEIRPAVRDDLVNVTVQFAQVFGHFRLTEVPYVPITTGRSQALNVEFEELM